ncbi:MAG TPA: hypothetical protein VMG41_01995 [Gemmatimonadales bacterium]|nr:hypothetical protein [Gemmatimonadales bacterium]
MTFDARYFTTGLEAQAQGLAGTPVVRMILHDGRELLVRDVVEAAPGYVMLEIYAPQGPARGSFDFPAAVSLVESATCQTAVAYEAIAQVFLQAATGEAANRLGFLPAKRAPVR